MESQNLAGALAAGGNAQPEGWRTLFKKNFVFTGGEIVNEFRPAVSGVIAVHPSFPASDYKAFIDLLKKLLAEYADKQVIHVVLDNFVIHSSRQTKLWLAEFGGKFRLHFLPPYCPDDNRIERKVWREVHANVTVNHRWETMEELMSEVVYYLMSHNRRARLGIRELRAAI